MVPLTSCQGDLDVTLTVSPEWGSGNFKLGRVLGMLPSFVGSYVGI
jgi:hypothetical protein